MNPGTRSALGLDIGGANLKVAHSNGSARLQPFALWKNPEGLALALRHSLEEMPPSDELAVTMTGELCDCFETKRAGVLHILDAVETVVGGLPVRVWLTDGRLVSLAEARTQPLMAAASNWLALATFAGRFAPKGPALLIDVGSTTTDIIRLHDGQPRPIGRTDAERLKSGELVYTGIRRTPICAVLTHGVMAELFATSLDAYLLLEQIAEDPSDRDTADGRPATRAHAHARLSRMLGADSESCSGDAMRELAFVFSMGQKSLIKRSVDNLSRTLPTELASLIIGGSGEFLVADALCWTGKLSYGMVSLNKLLGPDISKAACAYALATLAVERVGE